MILASALRLLAAATVLTLGALGVTWAPAARAEGAQASCPPVVTAPAADQIEQARREARDRGFLWRISKDGRNSYLYGTIHVGKLAWAFPGPAVLKALKATSRLALELDISDPAVMGQMQAAISAQPAPSIATELQRRLDRQADLACLPRRALASLNPVMQAVTFSVLAGRWDGLDPAFAQEAILAGFAHGAGHPIVSLETAEMQAHALVPADPGEATEMISGTLDQLEQGKVRPMLQRIARAWATSDLADISNYEQWCGCAGTPDERAMLKRMLDDRNPGLADGIARLHDQGATVFAAVGSLHMTGPNGLPRLLAARGFAVEPIAFAH